MSQIYYFLLGSTPDLSWAELQALLPSQKIELIQPQLASGELGSDDEAKKILKQSGGLVKILKFVKNLETKSIDQQLADYLLESQPEEKIIFSLSSLGLGEEDEFSATNVKHAIKKANRKVRYLETKSSGLSASVLLHHDLTELYLIKVESKIILAKTVVVQDIDDWTIRDRSKPYFDRKKGMLPPKIARIMVNIALGKKSTPNLTLYDPFCGSGTILIEATMLDLKIVGSDLDQTAVEGTQENLDWLAEEYNLKNDSSVFRRDATQKYGGGVKPWVDLLVTEPFLGKPKPRTDKLPQIFKGLEKLYLGVFKNWTKILNDGAQVVVVFPLVEIDQKTFSLESLIDKLANLGYTTLSKPIVYARPNAIVKRQIINFEFTRK